MEMQFPRVIQGTREPISTDDISKGIILGQPWVYDEKYFLCVNITENDAKWARLTLIGVDAEFTMSLTHGVTPIVTEFTNLSVFTNVNIESYTWDFGDGTPNSHVESPTHIFQTAGIFNVTLTVTSDQGHISTISHEFKSIAPISVDFILPETTVEPNVDLQLTNISSGTITDWEWDFGDGTSSTLETPLKQYLDEGTYNIALRGLNSDISSVSSKNITVQYAAWMSNHTYSVGDVIKYDTVVYEVISTHLSTPSFEDDIDNWKIILPDYDTNTAYGQYELVEYQDDMYIAKTQHSPTGVFAEDFSLITVWDDSTTYNVGDFVFYNSDAYRCTTSHSNLDDFDSSLWEFVAQEYVADTYYSSGDIRSYSGNMYKCVDSYWSEDSFDSSKWTQFDASIIAGFTYTPSTGTAPVTIHFTNTSTGTFDSCFWEFGDGTSSIETSPSHTYNGGGDFSPKLTIANSDVTDFVISPSIMHIDAPLDSQIQSTTFTSYKISVSSYSSGQWNLPSGWSVNKYYSNTGLQVIHNVNSIPVDWAEFNMLNSPNPYIPHSDTRQIQNVSANESIFTQCVVSDIFDINMIFDNIGSGTALTKYVITVNDWSGDNYTIPGLFTLSKINSDTGIQIQHSLGSRPVFWDSPDFTFNAIRTLYVDDSAQFHITSCAVSNSFTINVYFG